MNLFCLTSDAVLKQSHGNLSIKCFPQCKLMLTGEIRDYFITNSIQISQNNAAYFPTLIWMPAY